ncbi:2-oxoglutarate and iron-dependent oxygenase domain-containing protein [Enterobacter hormaechei]|uniref:isopenicillin N synthase family dioxygenase n=1 Tax=Enterobacter hormaechei TaxID=158836 RepID=UPI003CE84EA5
MEIRSDTNRSLQSKITSLHEIPIVDIAPLLDGSNPEAVAKQIGDIYENIGFLYVKKHGVSKELIDQTYRLAAEFFALPMVEKNKLHITNSGETLRGNIPMYAENIDPDHTRDFKESFEYGKHTGNVSPFFWPNQMQVPQFADTFERYHDAMMRLARKLISTIALSLNLPADYFEKLQRKPITIQRLLHYPSQSGENNVGEIGTGAHTDYGFFTILSQDANGGLQVQNREGEWVSAPPVVGTFVVNIGDLVQTFTNDRYQATTHRVFNKSGNARTHLLSLLISILMPKCT